jgi:hypothetical protein
MSTLDLPSAAGLADAGLGAGKRFGRFKIRRELGRGGMGVVFLAEHPDLKHDVALKILVSAEFASEIERRRFQREAEAAARLRHPNIVTVHDLGEIDGRPYFTMDAVAGRTLADWVRAVRPPIDRIVRVMVKVADAVGYAHSHAVVHRDLKPANIMVDENDQPYVMDFGLAKRLGKCEDTVGTASGTVIGTPHYMSPEQAAGDSGAVDIRTDVYSLGVILYELISGDVPFRADSLATLMEKIAKEEPIRLRNRNPLVPKDLDVIVGKAMAKEAEQRYWNAYALRADLERWLRNEPINARGMSTSYRLRKWVDRNRLASGSIAALALVVGMLFIVDTLKKWEAQAGLLRAKERREQAHLDVLRRRTASTAADPRATVALGATAPGAAAASASPQDRLAVEALAALTSAIIALEEARELARYPDLAEALAADLEQAHISAELARRLLETSSSISRQVRSAEAPPASAAPEPAPAADLPPPR